MFNLMRQGFYISTKCQADLRPLIQGHALIWTTTYLSKHLFTEITGLLDCLGYWT